MEAVFLSHLHHDHMSDLLILQYAIQMEFVMKGRIKPLLIYCPDEPKLEADLIPIKHFVEPNPIDHSTVLQFGDLKVSFLHTDHGVPTYAMKFQVNDKIMIYGADSGIQTNWSPFANNANLLILECTYLERHKPAISMGHLSTYDIAKLSNDLKPKQLLLTHFYPEYDPKEIEEEIMKAEINIKMVMPSGGKVIEI